MSGAAGGAQSALSPSSLSRSVTESSQHLRDIKLAFEYRLLTTSAPGGIYLLPEFDNIRNFHGVACIRRGLYRDGVFRFRLFLPSAYNSLNSHPIVNFTPPIFHPLVHPETGDLDLSTEDALKEWNPEVHFITTALHFLKKIFYLKSFEEYTTIQNKEALQMMTSDKEQYRLRIEESVRNSLNAIHDQISPDCTLVFTEPKPVHERLKDSIYETLDHDKSSIVLHKQSSDELDKDNANSMNSDEVLTSFTSPGTPASP